MKIYTSSSEIYCKLAFWDGIDFFFDIYEFQTTGCLYLQDQRLLVYELIFTLN